MVDPYMAAKTTLNIDEKLLARAKALAARNGTTLTALVEEALRARLAPRPAVRGAFQLELHTVRGAAPPAVDVADRLALYDLLDDGR
jgi:hypothetical protein